MATLGDLCESVIKRDLGIKDMSQVIPGHGGLMDRLDSLLSTVAPIWLLLHYAVFWSRYRGEGDDPSGDRRALRRGGRGPTGQLVAPRPPDVRGADRLLHRAALRLPG